VLVLGRGGAARAAAAAYRSAASVRLVSHRDADWPPTGDGVDVIVNCTPIRDETIVRPRFEQVVIDLAYRPDGTDTALVAAARSAGCVGVDGLDLLVGQGAASFELWTGQSPPLDAMRAALRA
jgi:shikimate 5-dehydrogenase